ncbi:flagellar biosynthesis protein FlhF [bacterium]|nr:flagellar biosynthesis protein FlhF [bacterium]MBU1880915.1 flagellar biosynthesis protein FlhF [bacterium]
MKIKKFVGTNMNDCLLQVKKELGNDAIILDSRKVSRGGPISFLLSDQIEVTASTPDRNLPLRAQKRDWSKLADTAKDDPARQYLSSDEYALLTDEIKGLKDTVLQMADHIKQDRVPSLPKPLEKMYLSLLDNGVDQTIVNTILQDIAFQLPGEAIGDRKVLIRAMRERIGKFVKAAPLTIQGSKPWVIALVGPTGVGKTTTIAKMATHPAIFGRKKVALVSADTYRIAAVEQLKTFASIASIPMEAIYRPGDIRRAINRFSDRDVVLIDTAGRSQNHPDQIRDLAAFMEFAKPDEIALVLSISTRVEDQLDVIMKYQPIGPRKLIFTKLDETTNYGSLLNVCFHQKKPIAMLTCGQNVPDDIVVPNQLQLVRLASEKAYFTELVTQTVSKQLSVA